MLHFSVMLLSLIAFSAGILCTAVISVLPHKIRFRIPSFAELSDPRDPRTYIAWLIIAYVLANYGLHVLLLSLVLAPVIMLMLSVLFAVTLTLRGAAYMRITINELTFLGYTVLALVLSVDAFGIQEWIFWLYLGALLILTPIFIHHHLKPADRTLYYLGFSVISVYIFFLLMSSYDFMYELVTIETTFLGMVLAFSYGIGFFHLCRHITLASALIPNGRWYTRLDETHRNINQHFSSTQIHPVVLGLTAFGVIGSYTLIGWYWSDPILAVSLTTAVLNYVGNYYG